MNIILLGIQGAGKSTQGNLLSTQLKLPYLSTGHIFRQIAKEHTGLGRHIKEIINTGTLVPDDLTIEIVSSYLTRPEYATGFILDGFPRTLHQAQRLSLRIDKVLYIEIDGKESLWRLVMRKGEHRDDNTIQAVQQRIDLFYHHTRPVIEYYRGKKLLVELDGMLTVEQVNDEILKSMGKQMVGEHLEKWHQKHASIVAFVGMNGSGKSDACSYLKEKYHLPVISFSNIINSYIDEHGLAHDEATHVRLRVEFRQKHGMEAMAVLNGAKLREALSTDRMVLIEGMYSWEEYLYLKKNFAEVNVYIVTVWADKPVRYSRVAHRAYRPGLASEQRDIDELVQTNKGPTIAFADYLVKNNFSRDEFHDKLDEIYRAILYS